MYRDNDEIQSSPGVKSSLVKKYKGDIYRQTWAADLDELKFFLKNQHDPDLGWNMDYQLKFESKLREYFHEDVLRREIARIEASFTCWKRMI